MADNGSQPGTSTGSGNTINNTISGNEMGYSTQNIYDNATFHQSTPSTQTENIQSEPSVTGTEEMIPQNLIQPTQQISHQNVKEKNVGISVDRSKIGNIDYNITGESNVKISCNDIRGPFNVCQQAKEISNYYNNSSVTLEPKPKRRNPINNIELAVNTFIGRKTELNDIKQLFNHYSVVVIAAMGGMGKTQLARKFASINAKGYRVRYWINAETEEQLRTSFYQLAEKVNVKANTEIETVREIYRSFTEGAALLIFDNVENVNNIYKYLPTRIQLEDNTLHVLITSRWTEWVSDSSVNCYPLQSLDISASLQLFQTKFGQPGIETMQDEWEELAETLGYLPLALQVATSYIYKRTKHNSDLPTVLADYMKQLKEGAVGLLNDPLTEYDNRSVYLSMMLTLKQLENKADNVSNVQTDDKWKFAVNLISAAAYMNPDKIKKQCLLALVDNDKNIRILDEALILLTEFSLFNQGVDRMGDKYYTVHRIIQTSIRHNQTEKVTGDMHYIDAVKCTLGHNHCYHWVEFQYVNERVSAVVAFYKKNSSPKLLRSLVGCKAITAVQIIFKDMYKNKNQIQSQIQQEELLDLAVCEEDLSMVELLCRNGANINQLRRVDGKPPLHFALGGKNMEIVKWLLQNGASLTVRDKNGCIALHAASQYANHKMVSDIIKIDRAPVHATDNNGNTPLHIIDYFNKEKDILATIYVLLENGADITKRNKLGDTVLHSIARSVCAAAVSLILQLNKGLINLENNSSETALHVIPYYDRDIRVNDERILSTIHVLIENGVDFSKVDSWGNTVLHSATCGARVEAVSLILERNKDLINIVNKCGETALHVIPYNTYIDDSIFLTICFLVKSGVDLTKVDIQDNTVLHSVARSACAAAVPLILQRNKDLINRVNKDGQTALHVISYDNLSLNDERILSTIRVLLESGVDLTKVDTRGNTVLHYAARSAHTAAASLILQRNKDLVNIINKDNETALHVIPYDTCIDDECTLSIIRVLVKNGLDLKKVDIWGNTALHTVARSACAAAVPLILQLNKDLIDSVNVHGETALHIIPYYETDTVDECILLTIHALVESGVDLSKRDVEGNTVLHYAARGACAAAVSLFLQLNKEFIDIKNEGGFACSRKF